MVSNAGATKAEDRTTFKLGPTNYLRAIFIHDRQKNRIMAANVKRLNNYEISPEPFAPIKEVQGEKSKPNLTGKLIKKAGRQNWILRNEDTEEFDIMLGYQNAKMRGFTIQDLVPHKNSCGVEWREAGRTNRGPID